MDLHTPRFSKALTLWKQKFPLQVFVVRSISSLLPLTSSLCSVSAPFSWDSCPAASGTDAPLKISNIERSLAYEPDIVSGTWNIYVCPSPRKEHCPTPVVEPIAVPVPPVTSNDTCSAPPELFDQNTLRLPDIIGPEPSVHPRLWSNPLISILTTGLRRQASDHHHYDLSKTSKLYFAISYFVPFVNFPSFSYLAALVAFASTNPVPFRVDEYHHDGQHALLLPLYPILVCEDTYYAKPVALHIIGKPVVRRRWPQMPIRSGWYVWCRCVFRPRHHLISFLTHRFQRKKQIKLAVTMRCYLSSFPALQFPFKFFVTACCMYL